MRIVLAVLLFTSACAARPHNEPKLGPVIGQSTAPGPSDPSRPLAVDPPDVTEGGGPISARVGSAPGSVTPTVGEQPSTIDQAQSSDTAATPGDQEPAVVYAPSVPAPVVAPPATRTRARAPRPPPAPTPPPPSTPRSR